ncbi:Leucine-rich-repeat receptor-like protein [Melia azedarach]|uniref:Leucine-rich-repeat receptor-like protein n=1 Tax=Melia azedarach TaxID=155640 RepID=A0ACC1XH32_MELAZ|nr:Leucine-rich-repeat receptor-like protein [Melia azedarach]
MGNPLPFCPWKVWLSNIFLGFCYLSILVSGQCLEEQKKLLLEFKDGLSFDLQSNPDKFISWSSTTNCCSWDGVTCDPGTGHVIGLDISSSLITGGINSSTTLFDLYHLQVLNLAYNSLYSSPFPSGFHKLSSLTHLNLSYSGFSGVPPGISSLRMLVSLDLSTSTFSGPIQFQNADLEDLVKNLTNLEELFLDGINISVTGSNWGPILSSLSKLRVLSLPFCNIVGPIHSSLSKLQFLTHFNLDGNELNSLVPDFIANFSSLKYLQLSSCGLYGRFPESIFSIPKLSFLDVSSNLNLTGSLPEFPPSSQLKVIKLSETRFSGKLPDSINNLAFLEDFQLWDCGFFGPIPSSFGNLTELINLDFSRNNFSGSLPLLASSKKVTNLIFSHNRFTGTIPLSYGDKLNGLQLLDLRNNSLHGIIPKSLFTKQSMENLMLGQNKLNGLLQDFDNSSSSSLREIDLSQNKLQGLVPMSIFQIRGLNILRLSSNNFTGTITLNMFKDLKELTWLELSDNNLSFNVSESNSRVLSKIGTLKLSSCNITEFPNFLRNKSNLFHLDLSNNKIEGEIPNWIWEVGSGNLVNLNLSLNMLEAFEKPGPNFTSSYLAVIDLRSNMLQGSFPLPPPNVVILDYSGNKLTSTIPSNIGKYMYYASFISFSSNNLLGVIPPSFCEAINLEVLDLSDNHFNGSIPSCLVSNNGLKVLKLKNNELRGRVPKVIGEECGLRTLDLSENHLAGSLSRSWSKCKGLEVLDVGRNQLNGSFPVWLETLPQLRVLILRSNNFDGSIKHSETANAFAMLQIIDLSFNSFRGKLPPKWCQSWMGMKKQTNESQASQILKFVYMELSDMYYQDSVTMTNKGLDMELVKILTIFTSIDIAYNQFEGEIPETLGDLDSLYVLNMSNNNFRGQIPARLGKLKELGSLDLSHNQLSGKIPEQLATLTFLSVLKLSQNLLVGEIPRGNQFGTFSAADFEGNVGLCGFPLPKDCHVSLPPMASTSSNQAAFDWEFFWIGFGFGEGTGAVIGITIGVVIGNKIIKKRRRVHKSILQWDTWKRNL